MPVIFLSGRRKQQRRWRVAAPDRRHVTHPTRISAGNPHRENLCTYANAHLEHASRHAQTIASRSLCLLEEREMGGAGGG